MEIELFHSSSSAINDSETPARVLTGRAFMCERVRNIVGRVDDFFSLILFFYVFCRKNVDELLKKKKKRQVMQDRR